MAARTLERTSGLGPSTATAGGPPVVVVGAGWSGLACAVQLVRQGLRPLVLDTAPAPGGRARGFEHDLGGRTLRLDNGQHLLVGAYRATLETIAAVGLDTDALMVRRPFAVAYPDGWQLAAWRAPAPLHLALGLVAARGIGAGERIALARWVARQRRARWALDADRPALALFEGEPPALVRRLWRPLCLAALNVELGEASGRILLNVLRDSLGAAAGASDLLLPRCDLSALFPDAAAAWLQARGAQLRLRTPVFGLQWAAAGAPAPLRLQLREGGLDAAAVVLALPPDRSAALLTQAPPAAAELRERLQALRMAPICTCYLRYAPGTRLARAFFALLDEPLLDRFGQWVFDRGAVDPSLDGVLAVVISGAGAHLDLSRAELGRRVAGQLSAEFGLPAPIDHYTVEEKHATIAPLPGLARPRGQTGLPGLLLAGDAAQSPYPSTIEGSVRAGLEAARALAGAPLSTSGPAPFDVTPPA